MNELLSTTERKEETNKQDTWKIWNQKQEKNCKMKKIEWITQKMIKRRNNYTQKKYREEEREENIDKKKNDVRWVSKEK